MSSSRTRCPFSSIRTAWDLEVTFLRSEIFQALRVFEAAQGNNAPSVIPDEEEEHRLQRWWWEVVNGVQKGTPFAILVENFIDALHRCRRVHPRLEDSIKSTTFSRA